MKLQLKATFSESQKAQIVSRGEEIGISYTFEMKAKYAALFPKLQGDYNVSSEEISLAGHAIRVAEYRNEAGKWINNHYLTEDIASAIATTTLKDGASCDAIMRKIEKLLDAKDAARQAGREKAEKEAARKERERPAMEATIAREKEESRIRIEEQDAEKEAEKVARRIEIETAKAEKSAWIEAHGSKRLQKGIAAGYHCQKIYIGERGKAEFGSDYAMDYDEQIQTKARSCPSLEALNETERLTKKGIAARVKWLPDGIATEEDCYEYGCDTQQSCEAVEAIFLGAYFYREF